LAERWRGRPNFADPAFWVRLTDGGLVLLLLLLLLLAPVLVLGL